MAVYKLSGTSVKNGRTEYSSFLAGNPAYTVPNSYESIATVTVGSGGSSNIEFSSIPTTYKHLQVRGIWLHSVSNVAAIIRFNSDSAANYTQHLLRGDGSSAGVGSNTTSDGITGIGLTISVATSGAGSVGTSVIDLLDYANTNKYKTVRCLCGQDTNGAGQVRLYSGAWLSTSAVSNIQIIPNSGSFSQYTQFALYGIKGA